MNPAPPVMQARLIADRACLAMGSVPEQVYRIATA